MATELEHEDDYASEEDSDFAPEDGPLDDASASEDEPLDGDEKAAPKPKRPADNAEADDAGFDNSGDEGIIEKGKKRRKKTANKNGETVAQQDDEGGDGGLIKTRSMRAAEKVERRMAAASGPVTVDVDALWAQMINDNPSAPPASQSSHKEGTATVEQETNTIQKPPPNDAEPSEMIRIKRTYNFAGKVHTEEKLVSRDSAEAKLYLASLDEGAVPEAASAEDGAPAKRMPRKAFRSAFEPLTDTGALRSDLNLGVAARLQLREEANTENAKKLNTVEKSRMDWAGYVDKEGIKDELELASKSKESYTGRQDFLARSEAIREHDARKARQSTRV